MQKVENISKHLVLLLMLGLLSCGGRAPMINVSRSEYKADSLCWESGSGNMTTLLVFGEYKETAVPYFISARCYVTEGYSNVGESTVDLLDAYQVDNSARALDQLAGKQVTGNTTTESPAPESNSAVYLFSGKLHEIGRGVHAIDQVYTLKKTPVTFGALLEMSPRDRAKLAEFH